MVNSLREIVVLPQGWGSIPSTHMVAHSVHNSNPSDTMPSSGDFELQNMTHTHISRQNTQTHKTFLNPRADGFTAELHKTV